MKRDLALIKAILLDIEEFDDPKGFMTRDDIYYEGITDVEKRRIKHHLDIMQQAGLISLGGPDKTVGQVVDDALDRAGQLCAALAVVVKGGADECVAMIKDARDSYMSNVHPHLVRDFNEGREQLQYFHGKAVAFFDDLRDEIKQLGNDLGEASDRFMGAAKQLIAAAGLALENAAARATTGKAITGITWSGYDLLDRVREPAAFDLVKDTNVEVLMKSIRGEAFPASEATVAVQIPARPRDVGMQM